MTKNVNHIQHIKSNVVVEGKPKLPQSSALVEGELAINYAENVETISLKNSNDDIVTFSSDKYYTEQKLGSGFTGENSATTVTEALENLQVGEEVEVTSGDTPTGDTIEIWIDESVDPLTVDAYTKAEVNALVNEKQDIIDDQAPIGNGVGVCSTSAETLAKEVVLADYVLVKNGFVSVTFENDVPSGSTLNINNQGAKPIYHKNAPIEDDVISSGDTVLFGYDGTNYVVSSLGGGSISVGVETLVINVVTQGDSSDTLGATITVTNNDTSSVISATTWQGTQVTIEVPQYCNYTITLGAVPNYSTPQAQTYHSSPYFTRYTTFTYVGTGVYIESTDGILYTASNWSSAGKTANSIVVISSNNVVSMALTESSSTLSVPIAAAAAGKLPTKSTEAQAKTDFDGYSNTNLIKTNNPSVANSSDNMFGYSINYRFPNGSYGYLAGFGELWLVYQNKTQVANCLSLVGGTSFSDKNIWSSTYSGADGGNYPRFYRLKFSDGTISTDHPAYGWATPAYGRAFKSYTFN